MDEVRHHLTVTLDGGRADQHRVGAADLAALTKALQLAVRAVAANLAEAPHGKKGRRAISKDLRARTELEIVASPRPGSFAVEMELSESEDTGLGDRALEALVDGLNVLRVPSEEPELPRGFDRAVLKAVTPLATLFGPAKGYRSVSLSLNGAAVQRQTLLNATTIGYLRRRERTPLDAPATVDGVVRMVGGKDHAEVCRIDRDGLPSVSCRVTEGLWATAGAAYGDYVRIQGIGHFLPGSDEPSEVVAESMTVLPGRPLPAPETYRLQFDWREQVRAEGKEPIADASDLAADGLFESDDDLDEFLRSVQR